MMQPTLLARQSICRRLSLWRVCFTMLIGLFLCTDAQANDLASQQAQLDQLYAQLLANPTDEDATLAYADLAVKTGDYEAAIPPLERLLLSNPESNKLRLELGVLYYLLGSHDVSKTYLHQVKNSKTADAALIQQADQYLQRM